MRVIVLSDTHAPRYWKRCPPPVAAHLDGADAILHAGDVCLSSVLDELAQWAPVHAVLGNNDGPDVQAWGASDILEFELGGLAVAMIHDSGAAAGRGPRLKRRFPHADLVVFGHSHIPWNEVHQSQRQFNPGSPTDKRRQPHPTLGRLEIVDGVLRSAEILQIG